MRSLRVILSSFALVPALCAGVAQAEAPRLMGPNGTTYAVPVTTLKGARFASTLRQQHDFSCGSAAVATLLTHHYDHPVGEVEVFKYMFERGDQARIRQQGFSMLDMKRYLDNAGFRAEGLKASLDQLAKAKVPAIALIKENGYAHFVVVKGLRGDRVVIGDPAQGTRVLARADFERYWGNGILLVVNQKIELARFNREQDWRVRPRAPIADGLDRGTMDVLLLRRGPMDY